MLTERPSPRQAAAAAAVRQHGAESRYAVTSGQLPGWTGTEHGGGFPGQLTVAGHEHDGRVRYWLGEGESALDVATTALSRAGELEQEWPDRFGSDAGVLRGKLALLREAVGSH